MYFPQSRRTPLPSLRPLAAAALLAVLALAGVPSQATVTTGSMTVPRMMHQATPLPDGRILFTGGYVKPGTPAYASTEIYDPASGVFTTTSPMLTSREEHAAVALLDGRILVMGGNSGATLNATNTAELYDPVTGQWTATGNMNIARGRTSARLLNDGRVFVMNTDGYSGVAYAEVYDPQTGLFTKTGNMVGVTGWHGLVVLADGRLLKVGGYGPQDGYSNRAEIWDPATNQWSATGSLREARQEIRPILLPDGRVLVAGGRNISNLNTTEIYDPATGLFSAGSLMPEYFQVDSSTTLPTGNIIFTGAYTKSLIHYQPGADVWNVSGPKRSMARETKVSRLPNGNLLLAGGAALNDATAYAAVWDIACAPQKIALTGATQSVAADGGPVSWTVTAAPGCHFEVSDVPAWLMPAVSGPLQMPATGSMPVSFTATANATGAARTANFMLGNNAATINQAPSPTCPSVPTVSPASFAFTSSARTGILNVSADAACPWTISVLPSWVTATSAVSGTGNGSMGYAVEANSGAARAGNGQLDALGLSRTFTMSQDAPPLCPSAPTLSPALANYTSDASGATVIVSAAATCPWTVAAMPGWVTLAPGANGTGNGSFSYTVAANSGAARSASGLVTGPGVASTWNVNQGAGACASWSVTPNNTGLPSGAYSGTVAVTAAPACNWSLGALPSWLTVTSGGSGSGNGSIGYTAAVNSGAARSATVLLSGSGPTLSLGFNQAAAPAPACAMPIVSGVPANGNLQASVCGYGARGTGYYTDRYTFSGTPGQQVTILLTSPAFDTYLYLKNPGGTVIKSDDDGGGSYNSRIPASSGSFTLPAGSSGIYTIEVTSYGQYRTGAYSLSFQ